MRIFVFINEGRNYLNTWFLINSQLIRMTLLLNNGYVKKTHKWYVIENILRGKSEPYFPLQLSVIFTPFNFILTTNHSTVLLPTIGHTPPSCCATDLIPLTLVKDRLT